MDVIERQVMEMKINDHRSQISVRILYQTWHDQGEELHLLAPSVNF